MLFEQTVADSWLRINVLATVETLLVHHPGKTVHCCHCRWSEKKIDPLFTWTRKHRRPTLPMMATTRQARDLVLSSVLMPSVYSAHSISYGACLRTVVWVSVYVWMIIIIIVNNCVDVYKCALQTQTRSEQSGSRRNVLTFSTGMHVFRCSSRYKTARNYRRTNGDWLTMLNM